MRGERGANVVKLARGIARDGLIDPSVGGGLDGSACRTWLGLELLEILKKIFKSYNIIE